MSDDSEYGPQTVPVTWHAPPHAVVVASAAERQVVPAPRVATVPLARHQRAKPSLLGVPDVVIEPPPS